MGWEKGKVTEKSDERTDRQCSASDDQLSVIRSTQTPCRGCDRPSCVLCTVLHCTAMLNLPPVVVHSASWCNCNHLCSGPACINNYAVHLGATAIADMRSTSAYRTQWVGSTSPVHLLL